MAVRTDAVGKSYPPSVYAVGREKVREYALAVGETNSVHLDVRAARRAGYPDVVGPPMFAVIYSTPAVVMAVFARYPWAAAKAIVSWSSMSRSSSSSVTMPCSAPAPSST